MSRNMNLLFFYYHSGVNKEREKKNKISYNENLHFKRQNHHYNPDLMNNRMEIQ